MLNRLGQELVLLRFKRKLLQKQVAFTSGIDASYLAAIEHGRRRPPPDQVIERLLKAMNATERERKKVRQAAVLDRLLPIIEAAEGDIRGASITGRFLQSLPNLTDQQLDAIDSVIRAMLPTNEENAMP